MIHKNIDLLFSLDTLNKIKEELDIRIKETLKEFNYYYNTKEPLSIKYEFVETQKGFYCKGSLYFGEKLIKEYEHIDLLFLDLENMMLSLLLKEKNKIKE